MDTVVRTPVETSERVELPQGVENTNISPSDDLAPPIDSSNRDQTVLEVIGVDDVLKNLPYEDQDKVKDISNYLINYVESKGKIPSTLTLGKAVDEVREELGMDMDTDPSIVIDKLSGVIRAWQRLTFIKDPKEKRSIFMQLAKQPDSKSMHQKIYEEMEKRRIWL